VCFQDTEKRKVRDREARSPTPETGVLS